MVGFLGCCYRTSRGGVRRFDLDWFYRDPTFCGFFKMERSKVKKNQTHIHLQLIGILTTGYNDILNFFSISAGGGEYSFDIHDHMSCDHIF